MRRTSLAGALFVVLMLAGCGSSGGSGGTGGGSIAGATPQDTFEAMKGAASKKDWTGMASCMTPEMQEMSIGGMAMMVQFMGIMPGAEEKMKGATEILKKHGVQLDAAPKMSDLTGGGDPAAKVDPKEAMKKLSSGVKDKAACLGELIGWFDQNADASQGKKMDLGQIAKSTLTDVKIDGDNATGKITKQQDGKDQTDDVQFKKIDGKWYIDMSPKMKG